MKRYILLSVWSVLFFSAMNFGMGRNIPKIENTELRAALLNNDKKGQRSERIDEALPKFKPGKPFKKIVNQEDSQKPTFQEKMWKKREIEMELNAMGFMTLEQANREEDLLQEPNYDLLPELINRELEKLVLLRQEMSK
jgi:hypothetical protein